MATPTVTTIVEECRCNACGARATLKIDIRQQGIVICPACAEGLAKGLLEIGDRQLADSINGTNWLLVEPPHFVCKKCGEKVRCTPEGYGDMPLTTIITRMNGFRLMHSTCGARP